jgi:predicted nucleic acid-binding protein
VIILDSSFLIAYHNKLDIHHAAAARVAQDLVSQKSGPALLLEYVFVEVVTVLLARRGLSVASAVAMALLQAKEIEFVPCSDLFIDALETFRNQKKTSLSFADAAIVSVARRHKGSRVATFDRDFRGLEGISLIP